MKVYIDRIPVEGLILEGEEPPEILDMAGADEKFTGNISLRVTAYKVSGTLLVSGRVSVQVDVTCSRCLKRFTQNIQNEKFMYDCEILGRDIIDLTEPIREDIIVGLPVRPLCREDCKGLCSRCGKDLNQGPCGCEAGPKPGGPFSVLDNYF